MNKKKRPPQRASTTTGKKTERPYPTRSSRRKQSPKLLSPNFKGIPGALTRLRQWVLWRWESGDDGRPTKVPYTPDGRHAKSTDPATWSEFSAVVAAFRKGGFDGVGFVFTKNDPFVGIDLDKCRSPLSGKVEPWAQSIITQLDSYTELSPSGTGIHILARAKKPGCDCRKHGIEVYDHARYFCVTGQHVKRTPTTIRKRQASLNALYADTFDVPKIGDESAPQNSKPASGIQAIISRLLQDKRAHKLWNGEWTEYESQSEADLALCGFIARQTRDPVRIDQIFQESQLNRPKKWDRKSYRDRTIAKALGHSLNSLGGAREVAGLLGPDDELDRSRIVRPELFHTCDVSAVAVPIIRIANGELRGSWSHYLRWHADGRRELRDLAQQIKLPSGDELWINTMPSDPAPTECRGWSKRARAAWLDGNPPPDAAKLFQRVCEQIVQLD